MCPAKATINMFCSNGNSEGERKSTAGIIFFLLRVSHLPSVLSSCHESEAAPEFQKQQQYFSQPGRERSQQYLLFQIYSLFTYPTLGCPLCRQFEWTSGCFSCYDRKGGLFSKLTGTSLCLLLASDWKTELPKWCCRVTTEQLAFVLSFLNSSWLAFPVSHIIWRDLKSSAHERSTVQFNELIHYF